MRFNTLIFSFAFFCFSVSATESKNLATQDIVSNQHDFILKQKEEDLVENIQEDIDQINNKNVLDSKGALPSSSRPCLGLTGGFVEVEYLYLQAQNNSFPVAIVNTLNTFPSEPSISSKTKRIVPKYKSSVRGTIGANLFYDNLEVFCSYMSCRSKKTSLFIAQSNQSIDDPISGNTDLNSIKNKWKLNAHILDAGSSYGFFTGKSIACNLIAGLRGSFLSQKHGRELNLTPPSYITKSAYWGIGPKMGINGKWFSNHGFAVQVTSAIATLYGKDKAKKSTYSTPLNTLPKDRIEKEKDYFNKLVPNLIFAIKFSWDTAVNNNKTFIQIHAGWEANYFWNMSMARNINNQTNFINAPLTIKGVTGGIKLDF
jgi:hypothetical protein